MGFSLSSFFAFLASLTRAYRLDRPLRRQDVRRVILRQIYFSGLQAFRMVALGATLVSFLVVAQSGTQLNRFGGSDALGPLLVAAFVRELGPLLTVLVIIARSISASASELASMKANGEIDSLRAAGVSPLSYLVFPRVLGGALSTLFLAMHFVWIALGIGFICAQVFVEMPWPRFVEGIVSALSVADLFVFFAKTFSLGFLSFLVAAYCGLRTQGASFEIPQATTKAVVWSFMFCVTAQALISCVYYLVLFKDSFLRGIL